MPDIDALFILNSDDQLIFEHHWRRRVTYETTNALYSSARDQLDSTGPFIAASDGSLLYHVTHAPASTTHDNVVFLLATSSEAPPLVALEFLHRIILVLQDYFGKVTSSTIEGNYDVICNLMYEMMDNGEPLLTEPNGLRDAVEPPSIMSKLLASTGINASSLSAATNPSISTIPWRRSKVSYNNNEIYVDVIERIRAITDAHGRLTHATVQGAFRVKCQISGVPDLLMNLSTPLDLPSLHPSIRLDQLQTNPRALSFIPPDGEFELATYETELSGGRIWPLHAEVRKRRNSPEWELAVSVNRMPARNSSAASPLTVDDISVEITLPSPASNIRTSKGEPETTPTKLTWSIGKLAQSQSAVLKATFSGEGARRPTEVRLKWSMTGWAASGMRVEGIKITKNHNEGGGISGGSMNGRAGMGAAAAEGKLFKGVKYATQSVDWVIRC
ncbi:clathrin adaptor, mu subunit [Saitoella complicata NRRL Y-17804]|uniref:clathrin adaptor, mu subunit n=1 Tax=Saitoella complicata (strain BCRC 22490 / CBS 7301 / JCM 7358 / NBRC 10748 / NRRL Y-17804) TaxID=698492 RepID=UPI00086759F9|nr:clathrin adaptor, mu subunit [Saitoella complicata NRRL Y-17804]ODQ54603.1 clathrin adaptor, mu subunit [Saitoella complicata NRRL Y-17804]